MHAFSRALTEKTYVVSKSHNLQKLLASRSLSSSTQNHAATAQQTQDERQEAKAKKMKKAVHSQSFVQNIFRGIVEVVIGPISLCPQAPVNSAKSSGNNERHSSAASHHAHHQAK